MQDTDKKEMNDLKNKHLKGFTLIECIIAMFILGISSLLLVQAYSQLMRVSSMSNEENISISKQMYDAERQKDASAEKVSSSQKNFIISSVQVGKGTAKSLSATDYTFKVDSYQVKGKVRTGAGEDDFIDATANSDADSMRYVYFK